MSSGTEVASRGPSCDTAISTHIMSRNMSLESRSTAVVDTALAAMNPQHVSVRSPGRLAPAAVCHVCHKMIEPGTSDNTGVIHLNCGTRIKGKVYTCGMCGEQILHYGNGKVHVNCRTLRDSMGEGEAKCYLHERVAKRGEKRTGASEYVTHPDRIWRGAGFVPRKTRYLNDGSVSRRTSNASVLSDNDWTDDDMLALETQRSTAPADRYACTEHVRGQPLQRHTWVTDESKTTRNESTYF